MNERNNVDVSRNNRFKLTVVMSKVSLKNATTSAIKVEDARNANAEWNSFR